MNNKQLREDLRKKFYQQFSVFDMVDLEGIGEDAIFDFILAYMAEREIELVKAFGGCKKCYGKGYSTVLAHYSGGHGNGKMFGLNQRMRFCSCERGKGLESEIALIKKQ